MNEGEQSAWHEVWEIVRQIPAGRVMNYGQVAVLHSRPLTARAVGWAMHDCPDDVPWHRVVNVRGECSADRVTGATGGLQRRRLEAESVCFGSDGRVDMARYRWLPDEEI
ncbi:MAG TPA: MGMT family protein [Acidobacteriota bacterium]|nr:MGMT family protein [Acidobacteriota bacterium]